ncbi:hypothetical protein ABT001_02955 [Streptomyces sp. NPDC002793]|uniref:hypothetical protein n=1 Tax=Streptomyces sp. NPDC002793 TaxID=3154432 RepID=UPI00332CE71D
MPEKPLTRRLLVLSATAAACTGTLNTPAVASTNVLAVGNPGFDTTMINMNHAVTAAGRTTHGSGLGNGFVQLPVDTPQNRGGGGSMLFSDRSLKTGVSPVVWER